MIRFIIAARSAVFFVGIVILLLIVFPIVMLSIFLPPVARARVCSIWARVIMPWLKICCGLGYRVDGLDHLGAKPAVLLMNHQSMFETLVVQVIFPPLTFVMKRELFRIPIFGWALWASRPIAIDRKAGTQSLQQVIIQGKKVLGGGRWVVIWPEGTRQPARELGKFNVGGAKLAVEAGTLVYPVAHDAGKYWRRRGFMKYPGTINIAVGPAIDTDGKDSRIVTQQARNWIEQKLMSW